MEINGQKLEGRELDHHIAKLLGWTYGIEYYRDEDGNEYGALGWYEPGTANHFPGLVEDYPFPNYCTSLDAATALPLPGGFYYRLEIDHNRTECWIGETDNLIWYGEDRSAALAICEAWLQMSARLQSS